MMDTPVENPSGQQDVDAGRWLSLDQLSKALAFKDHTALITGATGFLGSHFLYWWARAGGRSVALVRGQDNPSALARLRHHQTIAAAGYTHQIASDLTNNSVVIGDVCEPDLCAGVIADNVLDKENIRSVWHFAASLRFEDNAIDEIMAHNVEAVENVMNLAARCGATDFVYVSTAYSSGIQSGDIPETLHDNDFAFHNVYEQSKSMAEHRVMEKAHRAGLRAIILRPSIVVGTRHYWRPAGGTSGVYGLLDGLRSLTPLKNLKTDSPILLKGDPEARLDLVAVDDVIRDAFNFFNQGFPGHPVRHLTGTGPTMQDCSDCVTEMLGLPAIKFRPDAEIKTIIQRHLERTLRFYMPYFGFDGRFVRSLPGQDSIGKDDFQNIIKEYFKINSLNNRKNLLKTAI